MLPITTQNIPATFQQHWNIPVIFAIAEIFQYCCKVAEIFCIDYRRPEMNTYCAYGIRFQDLILRNIFNYKRQPLISIAIHSLSCQTNAWIDLFQCAPHVSRHDDKLFNRDVQPLRSQEDNGTIGKFLMVLTCERFIC